jgi:hypothetical protein
MTGTGKTTIIRSACDQIRKGIFGAVFFVSRADSASQDPRNIVRTLAYDLAQSQPQLRIPICDAVDHIGELQSATLTRLIKTLLVKPLENWLQTPDSTIVLGIDSMDDCIKSDGPTGRTLANLLTALLPSRVKLLLTGRKDRTYTSLFESLPNPPISVVLHEEPIEAVREDVGRYYRTAFGRIKKQNAETLPGNWPPPEDETYLVETTHHFFIFAAAVNAYVGDDRFDPSVRLTKVMEALRCTTQDAPSIFRPLDQIYALVLEEATLNGAGERDEELCHRMRDILAAIVFAQQPMSVEEVASITSISKSLVEKDLELLSAVLVVPTVGSSSGITVFHSSFTDFLCDASRCTDSRLRLHIESDHGLLALSSLKIMNESLERDICRIGKPGVLNADESYLGGLLSRLPPGLVYACRYWTTHLTRTGSPNPTLLSELDRFCSRFILRWLEVLSIIGQVYPVIAELELVLNWIHVCPPSSLSFVEYLISSTDSLEGWLNQRTHDCDDSGERSGSRITISRADISLRFRGLPGSPTLHA